MIQTLTLADLSTELQLFLFAVLTAFLWLARGAFERAESGLRAARAAAAKRADRINAEMDARLLTRHKPASARAPIRAYLAYLTPLLLAAMACETVRVIYRLGMAAVDAAARGGL